MSVILDIADEVVTELNTSAFSKPFAAQRAYVPAFKPSEMVDIRVSVVPKSMEISSGTRSERQCDYQVDIGVQQKLASSPSGFDQGDAAELDPLMTLVEEIADHFSGRALDTQPVAVCIAVENVPISRACSLIRPK